MRLWNVATGQCLNVLEDGHTSRIWSVTFSPDGQMLASTNEGAVRLWDINSGKCLRVLSEYTNWARSVAFGPDGKLLASGGEDRMIRLCDMSTGQFLETLQGIPHGFMLS